MLTNEVNSLYIHYPMCKHLCNYCDFYKFVPSGSGAIQDYMASLDVMLDTLLVFLEDNQTNVGNLKTIYIGGGTPSLWGARGADFVKNKIVDRFGLANDAEFTVEMNPGSINSMDVEAWKSAGVNRVSLGSQTLNERLFPYLDRVHSINDVYLGLEALSKKDLNFSVDFMLGLPRTEELGRNIEDELDRVLSFGPKHFSVYILTVKDNYQFYKLLPSDEIIEKEYLATADHLSSRGFEHYEVSNYGIPGYESRHNLAYWENKSVIALGPSATGFIRLEDKAIRYKWKTKDCKFDIEHLTSDELELEDLYLKLRTFKGISISDLEKSGVDKGTIHDLHDRWTKSGYIARNAQLPEIKLSTHGFLMLDTIMGQIFQNQPK